MARLTNALLGSVAWNAGHDTAMLDPSIGGEFGYAPNPAEWNSAQAYLPRNLIPIVLEAPKFFSVMPQPEKWVQAYKAFWEKHCRTIEGLKAGLTVDTSEHAFGAGGAQFQEFTDVKWEPSTLSTSLIEKYGNVYQTFFEKYIMYGMMHPETKIPLSATLSNGPTDLLADWYSGTLAFIEPDPSGKRVYRAWIAANVWPHGNGPVEGKMDKTSAFSIRELSLEFSILPFYNEGTRAIGQQLLDGLNLIGANPNSRAAFIKEVSADVAAASTGIAENIASVRDNQISGTL